MGNELDPSFVAAKVSVGRWGMVSIKQARTFDARVDARKYASKMNKQLRSSDNGRWRVIPAIPGPTSRLK